MYSLCSFLPLYVHWFCRVFIKKVYFHSNPSLEYYSIIVTNKACGRLLLCDVTDTSGLSGCHASGSSAGDHGWVSPNWSKRCLYLHVVIEAIKRWLFARGAHCDYCHNVTDKLHRFHTLFVVCHYLNGWHINIGSELFVSMCAGWATHFRPIKRQQWQVWPVKEYSVIIICWGIFWCVDMYTTPRVIGIQNAWAHDIGIDNRSCLVKIRRLRIQHNSVCIHH